MKTLIAILMLIAGACQAGIYFPVMYDPSSSNYNVAGTNISVGGATPANVTTNDTARQLMWTDADVRVGDAVAKTNVNSPVTWGDWRSGGDPIGFADFQFGSWSQNFTFASLTFSNILLNGSADYYYKGQKITKTNSSSVVISAANGAHYIYYDDASDTLKESMVPWNFSNTVQVAIVYKNNTQAFLANELHGTSMSWQQHENGHAQGPIVMPNSFGGLVASETGFSFGSGSWKDEDIKFTMPVQNNCSLVYHTNATTMAWTGMQKYPYLTNLAGNIVYDTLTTTQTVGNGNYVATWLVAAGSWPAITFCIVGQRQDTSLANARANATWASLDLEGYPSQEIRPLYRMLWRRLGGNNLFVEAADYRVDRFSAVGSSASFPYPPSDANIYGMRSNLWEAITTTGGLPPNWEAVSNTAFTVNNRSSTWDQAAIDAMIGLTNITLVTTNTIGSKAYTNAGFNLQAGTGMAFSVSGSTATLNFTNTIQTWIDCPNTTNWNFGVTGITTANVWYPIVFADLPANTKFVSGLITITPGVISQIARAVNIDHTNWPGTFGAEFVGGKTRGQAAGVRIDTAFMFGCTNKTIYVSINSTNSANINVGLTSYAIGAAP